MEHDGRKYSVSLTNFHVLQCQNCHEVVLDDSADEFLGDALRKAAGLLAGPEPWAWLAERDGEPVGLLAAQRPEAAHWIAPMVRQAPAAYLMLMFVHPAERGSGTGGRLVAEFHREADKAGVAVTLLHYEQLNPLSVPFWSRHGYRPLWTTWQATPASAIR